MDELYKGFIRQRVRRVLAEVDIPLERAIDFLEQNKYGVIFDSSNNEISLEELYNVKDFGRKNRIESDLDDTSSGEVHEDSDRELSFFDWNNSE